MAKEEKSREKDLVIQGIICGNPMNFGFAPTSITFQYYNSKFLLELKHKLVMTFKKSDSVGLVSGDKILAKCEGEFYIEKGDHVVLAGARAIRVKHNAEVPDSIYIEASKLYNETLNFSFDF